MLKLYGFEFVRKIAVSLSGSRREVYNPGDRVVVGEMDKIMLLRFGAKLLDTKTVVFTDVFDAPTTSESTAKKRISRGRKK